MIPDAVATWCERKGESDTEKPEKQNDTFLLCRIPKEEGFDGNWI